MFDGIIFLIIKPHCYLEAALMSIVFYLIENLIKYLQNKILIK